MSRKDFDGQRDDEEVQFVFRRHFTVVTKSFFFLILMAGVGLIPMVVFKNNSWLFWIWIGFLLIGLLGFFWGYMLWYFSVYIVTNQRIRQVSQQGLFKKTVVDVGLDKIQSISYDVPGLFGSLFRYGTLLVQTQVGDMEIRKVAKPEEVYNKLQDVMGEI